MDKKTIYLDSGDKAYLLFTIPKPILGEFGYSVGSQDKHLIQRVIGLSAIPAVVDRSNGNWQQITETGYTEILQEEIYEGGFRENEGDCRAGYYSKQLAEKIKSKERKAKELEEKIKDLEKQREILVSGREDEIKPLFPLGFVFYEGSSYSSAVEEYKVSGYRKNEDGDWTYWLISNKEGSRDSESFFIKKDGEREKSYRFFLTEKEAQDAIDKGAAEREIARQRERQREIERAKQILAENEEGK
jgi:hypothetical protein